MSVIDQVRSRVAIRTRGERVWLYARPRLPYRLLPQRDPIDRALAEISRPGLTFVQIGSNDGVSGDPIHRFIRWAGWRGAVVEPSPEPFARLSRNYGSNPRVTPVQSAVADEAGERPFFFIKQRPGDPWWADQIGSFDRAHLVKHAEWVPDVEARIETASVPVTTFVGLCERAGVSTVDLVHVDVEGYDVELVKLIPYDRFSVGALLFEHGHMSEGDLATVREHLTGLGFSEQARNRLDCLWTRQATGRV